MVPVRVMNLGGNFKDDPLIFLSQLLNNRYAQLGRIINDAHAVCDHALDKLNGHGWISDRRLSLVTDLDSSSYKSVVFNF